MIYTIDGRIMTINGNILERKVKTLTYQTRGKYFPMSYYSFSSDTSQGLNSNSVMIFRFTEPMTITISYGDGNSVSKYCDYSIGNGRYEVRHTLHPDAYNLDTNRYFPHHEYADDFTIIRNVTIEFSNPDALIAVELRFLKIRGALPIETSFFTELKTLYYGGSNTVQSVPDSFPNKLESYTLNMMESKLLKMPDSLFNAKLSTLSITSSFNLSNHLDSNFYKINQLKDYLITFSASECNIEELPDEIMECTKIEDLRISSNSFKKLSEKVNSLPNLRILYIGVENLEFENSDIPLWNNLTQVSILSIRGRNLNLSQIPTSWKYLYRLKSFVTSAGIFTYMIHTNQRFDEFIDAMYQLATENAHITSDSSAFGGVYPDRFRDISWGDGTLAFTGVKQEPSGYVQGVSNGTPANQGEKVYILQNQYGHTITHSI